MFKTISEKKVKFNMRAALLSFLFISPFIAAARIIINLKYIEEETGYSTSVIPVVHLAIVVFLALAILLFAKAFEHFYCSKSFDPTRGDYTPTNISPYSELIFNKNSAVAVFMSAFLGFAMLTSTLLMLFNLFSQSITANKFVMAISIIFLALSGIFFIVSATKNPSPHSKYYACLSFAPVLWNAMRIIICFMDTSRYMNTTARYLELLNAVALTFFFLYQSRFTMPDYRYHKMGSFFTFGLSSVLLIFASSIPCVISVAFFPYTAQSFGDDGIVFWVIDVIVMFYIVARLIRIMSQIDKITAEDLKDYARGYTKSVLKHEKN